MKGFRVQAAGVRACALAGVFLVAGLLGCGGGQAKLTPEQERFAKDTAASFDAVKTAVEQAIAATEQSADAPPRQALAALQEKLTQAGRQVAALRQDGGTWDEKKAAVEAALKELQLKVTETLERVSLPRAAQPSAK